jgi:hypothetical protein
MQKTYPDISGILSAKAQRRAALAALSWEEKVAIVEQMRTLLPKGQWKEKPHLSSAGSGWCRVMDQERVVAYVDESGNLSDPGDRYVAFAAIVTSNPRGLRKVVKQASRKGKKVRLKRQSGREIKWWNAFDSTRRKVLNLLSRQDALIFWLVVDKEGYGIPDTSENYGLMFCELMQECLAYYPELELLVDIHFGTHVQRGAFDRFVCSRLGGVCKLTHIDSQQDGIIQLADFVAGAVRSQFEDKSEFVGLIERRIVVGKLVKWRKLTKKK